MQIAKVIVDIASSNIDKIFDYILDEPLAVGQRVLVPFGNRKIEGYIISIVNESSLDESKLKHIIAPLDPGAVITTEQLSLAEFMKNRFYVGYADCIRLFLPPELRSGKVSDVFKTIIKPKNVTEIKAYSETLKKNATAVRGLIEFLVDNFNGVEQSFLNKKFGSAPLKRLKELDLIDVDYLHVNRIPYNDEITTKKEVILTPLQQKAVDTILSDIHGKYLIHGITGSGKTEVYMNVIKSVLNQGKSAMVLVPEISLTPQVLMNFRARFGEQVALLHSGLSAGERFDEWKRILSGDAKIVIGARSAVFCPITNLGVIIIDEEHDSSYFSESHPRYVTSMVAENRAKYNNCMLILGSATPSLVSYSKALNGEYKLIEMLERVNGQTLPAINIIDMGREVRLGNNGIFSNALQVELEKCIKAGNQAILFINRRGFASFVQCRECGWVAKCPDCDVSLSLHKEENVLKCHYCGNKFRVFNECPECHSDNIKYGSIGTERVVEEIHKLFPDVKVLRLDNDVTKTKDAHKNILAKFRAKEAQILVGTQMVAKGHDFPSVTLVGILETDLALYQSSYLATEKTFALVTQVAGRAGRADKNGVVILQSYSPNHYVYQMAKNYDYLAFFKKEINIRQVTKFPPFSVIVRILLTSEENNLAIQALKVYYNNVLSLKDKYPNAFIYLNKMKSPLSRIMKKYRYQIIMRLEPEFEQKVVNELFDIDRENKQKNVQSFIEVNALDLR